MTFDPKNNRKTKITDLIKESHQGLQTIANHSKLESYFGQFRDHVVGADTVLNTQEGKQKLVYADWMASGRLYGPIEDTMRNAVGPMIANPHSFSSDTGKASTYLYQYAREIIKKHVNADERDILVTAGHGMTGVVARLQRIMGLRGFNSRMKKQEIPEFERPVVFITHMEHHSNHVSWMETIADVVVLPCGKDKLVSPKCLGELLKKYKNRPLKIGAFTACSNVTGAITPYYELSKVMHKHGGYCFVDFAASAPYVSIDMHPENEDERLDAIYFSPHKFLGGPGSCGVLVFNKDLYHTDCPDVPGGGNVKWTNPWGGYGYFEDIEVREDGGTPGFLQVVRAALAIRLKEKMNVGKIEERERELLSLCIKGLQKVPGLYILELGVEKRVGCISFGVKGVHYNLIVRILNDNFGIQVRGGWSCASTYGHYLFDLDEDRSKEVIDAISNSDLSKKPGWVRISLHPLMTDCEVRFICNAINTAVVNAKVLVRNYKYNPKTNEFEGFDNKDLEIKNTMQSWLV